MAKRVPANAKASPLLTGQARRTRKPAPGDHLDLKLWLRLLNISNQIKRLLAARLLQDFDTSMARFDLLAQLERAAPPQGLSMTALSARVMVTNGAITGLVDGLVRDGLVKRRAQPGDRRTVIVGLTPLGKRRFLAMARRHESWVKELFSGVPAGQKQDFERCLAMLKIQLQGVPRALETD